jgi:hypothetical protein
VRSAHDVGVSPSQLQTAEQACYDTLPINDTNLNHLSLAQCEMLGDCPPVLVQQALTQLENFARCMRSHGVPKWPDPTIGEVGPLFSSSAPVKTASTRIRRRSKPRTKSARAWSIQTPVSR